MKPKNELIFLPLGGSGEIGMNVNLYGCDGKWLMVDLGMTFADASLPGVELVLPDLSFIEDRLKDLVGIVITHGHEDHIGAIPYLAADLGVPIYATPFTAALIKRKLHDDGQRDSVDVRSVPIGGEINAGPFRCRYVAVAHSIPEGNALVIDTPHGRVFHTGDWKLDEQPLLGNPASEAALRAIGDEGVLAMVCDSTNVFSDKASGSEGDVREGLTNLVRSRRKGRVLVTTFASNAARLDTLGRVAQDTGRRIVVAGRALDRMIEVAKSTGYLRDFPQPVSWDDAATMNPEQLLIISTGTQGEPMAALARIAEGTHPIKLEAGDLVVYSSRQIPGNETAIGRVQNALAARGVEVITDRQAHVHVSGHPGRPELAAMYGWIRPRIAIPVHGERRHLEEHARYARSLGVPASMVPDNGLAIRLGPDGPAKLGHEPVGRLILDGDVILPADGATMNTRRKLATVGYMAATLVLTRQGALAADPQVLARGVPVEEDEAEFLEDCVDAAAKEAQRGSKDLEEKVRLALRKVAKRWTGKKPVTDVTVVRL